MFDIGSCTCAICQLNPTAITFFCQFIVLENHEVLEKINENNQSRGLKALKLSYQKKKHIGKKKNRCTWTSPYRVPFNILLTASIDRYSNHHHHPRF